MKKLFSAKITIFAIIMILLTCCSTNSIMEDQIVKTAIDLAQSYAQQASYDKAIEVYEKALKEVTDYRLLYNLSIVQYSNGDYEQALSTINRCLKLKSNDKTILQTKAKYCEKCGQYDDAIKIFNKFLKEDSKNIDYKKSIINLLVLKGDKQKAYSMALELWNSGTKDGFTAEKLYQLGGDEWLVVNKVLNSK